MTENSSLDRFIRTSTIILESLALINITLWWDRVEIMFCNTTSKTHNSCVWLLLNVSLPKNVSSVKIIIGLLLIRLKFWKTKLASFQLIQQEITNIISQTGKPFYKDSVIIETKLLERCFLMVVSMLMCCVTICMSLIFVEYLICSNILHSHMFIMLLLIARHRLPEDFNISRHEE